MQALAADDTDDRILESRRTLVLLLRHSLILKPYFFSASLSCTVISGGHNKGWGCSCVSVSALRHETCGMGRAKRDRDTTTMHMEGSGRRDRMALAPT